MTPVSVPAAPVLVPPAVDALVETGDGESVLNERVLMLGVDEVFVRLGTSWRGLTSTEAAARTARYGPNRLPVARRTRLAVRFLRQLTDLFALVLVAAAVVTLLAYFIQLPHDVGNLQLSVAIMGVVTLNAWIGFLQEYSAERTTEALRALVPERARVLRDGDLVEMPAAELVPGDLVVVEAGDSVSADCRVVEAHELSVDMAALTGESQPVPRTTEPADSRTAPLDSHNALFMGSIVTGGRGRAVVHAIGLGTQFGHIYRLTAEVKQSPTPLQRQVTDMARRVAVAAISIGGLIFVIRSGGFAPTVESFVFALGVMVALVPEGLPATMSVSLAVGVRRMARRNALVKRLLAVEALGSTTVICTDKTGTLTTAEMTVRTVWHPGGRSHVTGSGFDPVGAVEHVEAVRPVLRAAAMCSTARLLPPGAESARGWRVLGDPTEGALLVAARKAGIDVDREMELSPRLTEFPFDSSRKLMSTVHQLSTGGAEAYVKGALQELLPRCAFIRDGSGDDLSLLQEQRQVVERAGDRMAAEGLRVLAVACRTLDGVQATQDVVESDLVLLGLIGMLDPPRPEVEQAVRQCHQAGIRMIMVTGDYGLTAASVARKLGMVQRHRPRLATGVQLDAMSDRDLGALLADGEEIIFARVKPEHKLRIVSVLEAQGEVVAVTGDGVNDAPALKRADIGVAMGRGGTDVAREAAQMVLLDDSFASIVAAIELGRSVYRNIQKFLVYLFSHNLAELSPILVASAAGFPLVPLTALQVLAIDLGSDVMPALALGMEPPEPGIMSQPPRSARERLFSWRLAARFLFLGGIQSIGVVIAFFWRIHSAGMPFSDFSRGTPAYREAITMVQAGIVVSQVFNGFAVRTDLQSVFKVGLLSNWRLVVGEAVGVGIVSCISYLSWLQAVFHTAPLSAGDWVMLTVFGLILFVAEEMRKLWLRRRTKAYEVTR